MKEKRELWVDAVKLFACILVVLGHFFQSIYSSNILPENNIFLCFNRIIYSFHVALFFICSGFLYQKYASVIRIKQWMQNVIKKFVALFVPYVVFTTVTYIVKTVFSSSVNSKVEDGLFEVLFLSPIAPYWYLYASFFLFVIIPTVKKRRSFSTLILIAAIVKVASLVGVQTGVYAFDTVFANAIWFVIGMGIHIFRADITLLGKKYSLWSFFGILLFLVLSVINFCRPTEFDMIFDFCLGLLACISIFVVFLNLNSQKLQKFIVWMSGYTMPIYLMHTLCAAALRIGLLKLNITGAVIHIVLGLAGSFIGPMLIAEIMNILHPADFIIYPLKYIRLKKKEA